jgi:hypothetical protein
MKVLIQRIVDELFLKTESVWVSMKDEARDFGNCTPAVDFCVEHELKDVRLCLSFGDAQYDLFLNVFRADTKALVRADRDLRAARKDALPQPVDVRQAEMKERKKQIPFKREGGSKVDG